MDPYTARVKHSEIEAKRALDLAKVTAERDATLARLKAEQDVVLLRVTAETEAARAVAEAEAKGALMRAETELIKTRAEHADNEHLRAAQTRALEQIRIQGQLKMAALVAGTLLISILLVVCR